MTLKGFKLVFKFTGIRNRGYKSKVHSTPLPEKAKTAQEEVSGAFLDLFQDLFIYLMSNDKIEAWEPSTGLIPADISCHLQPPPIFYV